MFTLSPPTDSSAAGGRPIAILFTALQHSPNSKSSMFWKWIQYLDRTYAVIRKKSRFMWRPLHFKKANNLKFDKMTTKLKRQVM